MAREDNEETAYLGEIDVKAAALAGLAGAGAFLVVMLLMAPLMEVGVWRPFYLIAAVVMGAELAAVPAEFNLGVVATALGVHLVLSLLYAGILSGIIHNQSRRVGVVVGLVFGMLLFIINLYFFTSLFPWFAEARNWIGALAHLAFGGVAGWVYVRAEVLAPKRRPVKHHA